MTYNVPLYLPIEWGFIVSSIQELDINSGMYNGTNVTTSYGTTEVVYQKCRQSMARGPFTKGPVTNIDIHFKQNSNHLSH